MNYKTKILIAVLLIAVAVAARLIPHAANMTPVIAVALVSAVYLGRSYAFVVPLVAMLVADVFIGFYSAPIMITVYSSIVLAALLGGLLRKRNTLEVRIGASLVASTIFFLVTNWAVWQFGSMYADSFAGLMESYTLGLPFYRNALVGDLFYTVTLFGAFEVALFFAKRRVFAQKGTARIS